MFRTSYVHYQEHYIVHAALYGMFSMHLFKHSSRLKDVLEMNHNINLNSAFCWLTLHNCIKMHATQNINCWQASLTLKIEAGGSSEQLVPTLRTKML
jgi:hypothetical protein